MGVWEEDITSHTPVILPPMNLPPRPFPQARLLAPDDPVPDGAHVWLYEGTLERFTGTGTRFPYRQRVAWPPDARWEEIRDFGLWMVERLSINGHVLLGLRARGEEAAETEARLILPEGTPDTL